MSYSFRIPRLIACIAVSAALAGPALAAQTWHNAPKGAQIDIVDYVAQLGSFSANGVELLINAKTVDVYTYNPILTTKFDSATHHEDQTTAMDELTGDQGMIEDFQRALRASPKAMKLLKAHNIKVVDVVDVEEGAKGEVKLFVR